MVNFKSYFSAKRDSTGIIFITDFSVKALSKEINTIFGENLLSCIKLFTIDSWGVGYIVRTNTRILFCLLQEGMYFENSFELKWVIDNIPAVQFDVKRISDEEVQLAMNYTIGFDKKLFSPERLILDIKNKIIDLQIENSVSQQNSIDLLTLDFKDSFYLQLKSEINYCYKYQKYVATIVLSRKMIENLVIDVLRKKFPIGANPENLGIYFIQNKKRFKDFSILIEELQSRKSAFGPDESVVDEVLKYISKFREVANSNAHSITSNSSKADIDNFNINLICQLISRLLENLNTH